MFILYDLIFLIISLFYLPVYLFRGKFHRGFAARLGFLPKGLTLGRPIWIHAVSVGEAMAVRPLVRELKKTWPGKKFVLSTVTPTGNKIAQGIAGGDDLITFLPLDFSFIVKRVIRRINPCVFIIVETEIWPNLISRLYKNNIPIVLLNARISDKSFKGYRMIKFLMQPILRKVGLFCVQAQRDAERLLFLGASPEKVKVTGNMKFDLNDCTDYRNDYTDYRIKLGLNSGERLLVAGSTHPGEEEIMLQAYKGLLRRFPDLKLLLAPRHPQRSGAVAGIASRFAFHPVCVSQLPDKCPACSANAVFILDTVGELVSFYCAADIVFVGGSLVKRGGHNILEPAAAGKPVIFGPFMFNFRGISELFLKNEAAFLARGPEELEEKISWLLSNPARAAELAVAGRRLIQDNQGATRRNLEYIKAACFERQVMLV
ncbi:MAG: 3-deoxy-D-manno-octulosonic acid transferase [Candidatus Omnitrophota bacterium]|nr:3-deoxy-D-manno-octulosonic acid transferase [Candidatus Omnitrophota bacterium]